MAGVLNCSYAQETNKEKKLKLTFSERIRLTTIDNAILLDNDADIWTFTRFRTYAGVDYAPVKNLDFRFQLGNEARVWFSPASKHPRLNEIFVNQLYINWKNIAGIPLNIKAGRQNIMLDEGFICLDGQPLTGSRSAYFNALRGDYKINDKNSFTAFVSYNTDAEEFIPLINAQDPAQALEEQTNTGLGIYYKSKLKPVDLSVYYFLKHTFDNEAYPIESGINLIGARGVVPLGEQFKVVAEGGYQFGTAGDNDRSAFGGYAHFDYKLPQSIPVANLISVGGFYLSGDDPATDKVEGWDPLWSRWPKWSESYIYTLIIENAGKVAYWSNISSINVNINGDFSEKVSFKSSYHRLMAPEDNLSDFCGGTGSVRGDLFIIKTMYKIDDHWSGHLLWENFTPGDFYSEDADGYNWVRFELMYKF